MDRILYRLHMKRLFEDVLMNLTCMSSLKWGAVIESDFGRICGLVNQFDRFS